MNTKKYKSMLLDKRHSLMDVAATSTDAAKIVELDQSRVGRLSRMDAMQGQAMAIAAERRRQIELQRIATALQRLDNDEYGYCLNCDELISERRLEVDPTASLCITCASDAEEN